MERWELYNSEETDEYSNATSNSNKRRADKRGRSNSSITWLTSTHCWLNWKEPEDQLGSRKRGSSFQRWSPDQPRSASTATNGQKQQIRRSVCWTEAPRGPGPWTGTLDWDLGQGPSPLPQRGDFYSLAVTGGVFLSGSTRLWPQPDKRAEDRGDTRDDGGETWGWGLASGAHLLSDTLPLPFCAGVIRSPSFRALIQLRGSVLARRTPTAQ